MKKWVLVLFEEDAKGEMRGSGEDNFRVPLSVSWVDVTYCVVSCERKTSYQRLVFEALRALSKERKKVSENDEYAF